MYLNSEEVVRHDAQEYTQADGTGFLCLCLNACTDMMYPTTAKTLLPLALRNDVQAETRRLESNKSQADGTGEAE